MLFLLTIIITTVSSSPQSLRANNHNNHNNLVDPFNLSPSLRELNKYDGHQVRLESLGYFFKTYTQHADKALHKARETIRRVLGDEAESQAFQGRASLFEENGALHKYTPLVYELAGIKGEHHKPKHRRIPMNHTIAMIEERMELGLIEFSTYAHAERVVLRRRLHLQDDDSALAAALIETQRSRRSHTVQKSPSFFVTPRKDPIKGGGGGGGGGGYGSGSSGSSGSGGGVEETDDVSMPNYVQQVNDMMKRQKAAREAAKAKGKAAENMRKASKMEEEIKQKKEEVVKEEKKQSEMPPASQDSDSGDSSDSSDSGDSATPSTPPTPPKLTKPADTEEAKDEKEGEETMKRVAQESEEKKKALEKANEAAKKLQAIEQKAEEKAASETMKRCEQEMKRLGIQEAGEDDDDDVDEEECNPVKDVPPLPSSSTTATAATSKEAETEAASHTKDVDNDPHPGAEYVVMDLVVTKFNHEQCTERQGKLITQDLVCRIDTSQYVDDGKDNVLIEQDRRKLIEMYELQPDWTKTKMWDKAGRFLGQFHSHSILEINIRTPEPAQTFTWLFPSGKTIEIGFHFRLLANDRTMCPASTVGNMYTAPIESFHQPGLYKNNINPFFQGKMSELNGAKHRMEVGVNEMNIHIDNYTVEDIASTMKSSFKTISLRIPYDATKICDGYTFPLDDSTKTSPTLEVQIWPYDDGLPLSVTRVVESVPEKDMKSCTKVKIEKATKCAKKLMNAQIAKLDQPVIKDTKTNVKVDSVTGKSTGNVDIDTSSNLNKNTQLMSEKVCSLLRGMKSAALASKLPSLCPPLDPVIEAAKKKQMNDCVTNAMLSNPLPSLACQKLFENSPVGLEDVVAIAVAKQKVEEANLKVKKKKMSSLPVEDVIAAGAWKAMDMALKNKRDDDKANAKASENSKIKTKEKKEEIVKLQKEQDSAQKSAEALAKVAAIMAAQAKSPNGGGDCDPATGKPASGGTNSGGDASLTAGAESGWPNGEEPPEAASYDAKIEAAHKKRVVGIKLAQAFATLLEGAGGMALGAALGESLSATSSKMGRLATAMATGMVTTMWMGTMSAPWIHDGRMEELCKIAIVEKRDYCNKENDKALTDCPVASPAVSSICVKQIAQVTDPGTMITLMNPPPVGTGPAPPFVNVPCITKQGPCQKDAADQFMMGSKLLRLLRQG